MSDLSIASAAMQVIKTKMEVDSGNLANAGSPGFQEIVALSVDTGYTTIQKAGTSPGGDEAFAKPVHVQRGTGSKIVGTTRNLAQGLPHKTDDPLHLCIRGSGYFPIQLPNEERGYTRNGTFAINKDRRLVTVAEGYPVGDIANIPDNVDESTIKISAEGVITATDPADATNTLPLGQLTLATFSNVQALENRGNYFIETDASGEPNEFTPGQEGTNVGTLMQGYYEESNISTVKALTNIIQNQTIYTTITKVVEAYQERERATNAMYSGS